eukprot:10492644-Alexandrium_andersonii.AAC.1
MSASLVGSEMCIRDRPTPRRPPLGPPQRAPRTSARLAPPGLSVANAVSYTHLTLPTICSV